MTNSEYFEKNKISFTEAMELFNAQKEFKSFDKFLASEHVELKFKVGDLIVLDCSKEVPHADGWDHNVVFVVMTADKYSTFAYDLKALTPSFRVRIGESVNATKKFVEDNCTLY